MAFPDTDQERRDRVDIKRDPQAIDTRSSINWTLVLGIIAAAVLLVVLLGSFGDTKTSVNNPTGTLENPQTPPPTPAQ